ncbi:MAG: nucleotidyltransferase [Pedobacter sp.]|nr:MAG: nucleotidyltransferase [Pedobacter sp.]
MIKYQEHMLHENNEARVALRILDELPDSVSRTLFIIDLQGRLLGALTDGDIRRGLLNGLEISDPITAFMNRDFKFIKQGGDNLAVIKNFKRNDMYLVPVIEEDFTITRILNLKQSKTILPISALIMAGGRGERLKPLTDTIPKPMLLVGGKPIIEHNIDRLILFGVSEIYISVKYLKEHICDYFGDGSKKGVSIKYIEESEPLGTLGALTLMDQISYDDLLVMNSDILTNIDFEDFFKFYKQSNSSMAVTSIPYNVSIPYAVLQTDDHIVSSFIEKPTYTYYSNGGIYLMKFSLKKHLEKGTFINATDLMEKVIEDNYGLIHYPLLCYWLDIGKHQDYIRAQEDIKHINLL